MPSSFPTRYRKGSKLCFCPSGDWLTAYDLMAGYLLLVPGKHTQRQGPP